MLTGEVSDSVVGVGGSTDAAEEDEGVDRAEDDDEEEAVGMDLVALVDFAVDDELAALREDEAAFDLETDSVLACFRALVAGSGLDLFVVVVEVEDVDLEELTETVAVESNTEKGKQKEERQNEEERSDDDTPCVEPCPPILSSLAPFSAGG